MPARAILMRLFGFLNKQIDKNFLNYRLKFLTEKKILKSLNFSNREDLFSKLKLVKHPCVTNNKFNNVSSRIYKNEKKRVISKANEVIQGKISLLGCDYNFEQNINWHYDCKSNFSWPYLFFSEINILDLEKANDVKVPWEISRLQWIIPVVQAWIFTKDEKYSKFVKAIIINWINNNTYGMGVNWSCTMEPSMRVFVWVWIYQTLNKSKAWDDPEFKYLFVKTFFLHLLFIKRYIEITDINGNHLLSNSAALVVGGIFLGDGKLQNKFTNIGLSILEQEIEKQVYEDGVNFEGSIPYHRLATELFFFPAIYSDINSKKISLNYKKRVIQMADYIKHYTKPDGSAPIFGDADDGRVLPLGNQGINDHRYLYYLISSYWSYGKPIRDIGGYDSEKMWWNNIDSRTVSKELPSTSFKSSGNYIMRSKNNYLFIDCGPLGLRNRGGHGHNDCLSFEAVLCGVNIICDSGNYTYSSDYNNRNHYRSVISHNTPMIANSEINRLIDKKNIWFLHYDADPELIKWEDYNDFCIFKGTHTGYTRLKKPVKPIRTILLDKNNPGLIIHDEFTSHVNYSVDIPLHLCKEINIKMLNKNSILLEHKSKSFILEWEKNKSWDLTKSIYNLAESYGVSYESTRLCWHSKRGCRDPLTIYIYPKSSASEKCRLKLKSKLNDNIQ